LAWDGTCHHTSNELLGTQHQRTGASPSKADRNLVMPASRQTQCFHTGCTVIHSWRRLEITNVEDNLKMMGQGCL
jgi:hypothetical protein